MIFQIRGGSDNSVVREKSAKGSSPHLASNEFISVEIKVN